MKVELEISQATLQRYQDLKEKYRCEDESMLELLMNTFSQMKETQATKRNKPNRVYPAVVSYWTG